MPNNPYGSGVTSSLPARTRNTVGGSNGSNGTSIAPPNPVANLLVADTVLQEDFDITSVVQQIDKSCPSNRISMFIQNNGTDTVEVFLNNKNPTFGVGGIKIVAGQAFDFSFTEDVSFYVLCDTGNSSAITVVQSFKNK